MRRRAAALLLAVTAASGCERGRCRPDSDAALTREVLDRSLELGTAFLLHNQRPEGNFNYEYDWRARALSPGDNQVRQAGATWGLATIYQDRPDPQVAAALDRALAFFERHSIVTPAGDRVIAYPGEKAGRTGTVALVALALIDYLRAPADMPPETRARYRSLLDQYLAFLVRARTPLGQWHGSYRTTDGRPYGPPSPYFDGEALLALARAARYMGRDDLRPLVMQSAAAGYLVNVALALMVDPDSDTTKGYYQWSSMAFFEIATSGWPGGEPYGRIAIDLADWMIDVHRTLTRARNTGYAYEGIVHAYELARRAGDDWHTHKLGEVIRVGMTKLTSWQVGSPIANACIGPPPDDPLAIGGVQNHHAEPGLRIDVAQHQMHAVILARRYWLADR